MKAFLKNTFENRVSQRKTTNGGWIDSTEIDWGFGNSNIETKNQIGKIKIPKKN